MASLFLFYRCNFSAQYEMGDSAPRYWSRTESTNSMLPPSLPGRRFHERERFGRKNTSLQIIIYDWSWGRSPSGSRTRSLPGESDQKVLHLRPVGVSSQPQQGFPCQSRIPPMMQILFQEAVEANVKNCSRRWRSRVCSHWYMHEGWRLSKLWFNEMMGQSPSQLEFHDLKF